MGSGVPSPLEMLSILKATRGRRGQVDYLMASSQGFMQEG